MLFYRTRSSTQADDDFIIYFWGTREARTRPTPRTSGRISTRTFRFIYKTLNVSPRNAFGSIRWHNGGPIFRRRGLWKNCNFGNALRRPTYQRIRFDKSDLARGEADPMELISGDDVGRGFTGGGRGEKGGNFRNERDAYGAVESLDSSFSLGRIFLCIISRLVCDKVTLI